MGVLRCIVLYLSNRGSVWRGYVMRTKARKGNHIELHKRNEANLVIENFKLRQELHSANQRIIELLKEKHKNEL